MNRLFIFTLAILIATAVGFGQTTSSGVTGVVTDKNGAVVPGVNVTLLDTKTATELTTTTNDKGVYSFANVQAGPGFKLTFAGQGFQTYVLTEVQLGVGRIETQNVELNAGAVSESVEVVSTSGDATLNTTDASIGNVIGRRQLRELPIQLRQSPAALIGLQPGAIGSNVAAGGGNRTGSVTGARVDQGNITVDGIDANDQTTGQAFLSTTPAPIDAIQEFRAVTSGPNAIDGRSSGGQIQLTTNSGTNEFHGSLREYWRHESFAANSFFNNRNGVLRPRLRRHQYGGSIGGPLPFPNWGEGGPVFESGKDKLFFFFDYEARQDRSQTATSRAVPLQHVREGRIGYILATSTATGAACPANSRLDTRPDCIGFASTADIQNLDPRNIGVNSALLDFVNARYPLPNDLAGGNGVNTGLLRWNAPNVRDDDIYTARVDATPTANQRIFGRVSWIDRASTNAIQFFPGDPDSVSFGDSSYGLAFGHTWIINPRFTNVITAGLTASKFTFTPPSSPTFPISYTFGGIGNPFPSLSYQDRDVYVPTYRDDMTWIAGNHTLMFGVSYKPIRQDSSLINDFSFTTVNGVAGNAALRPANIRSGSTGAFDSMFGFMLGNITSVGIQPNYTPGGDALPPGTGKARSYTYNEYEFYVQDNWRIRNDLTLNLGVRYHVYPAPYERNGFQADQTVDYREIVETRLANAAAGISGESVEPFLSYDLSGKVNDGVPFYYTDKDNFAPRVGFAYNPSFKGGLLGALFGDRKTVLRGNYSMAFDRVGGAITFIQNQVDYLFNNSATRVHSGSTPANTYLNNPRYISVNTLPAGASPPEPVITIPFVPFVEDGLGTGGATGEFNYTIDKNFKIPYSHTFNVGIQRELPGNMIIDVSYVGRLGRSLFVQNDVSQITNFRDNASGQMMFDAFNVLQAVVQANVDAGLPATSLNNIVAQPWFENQIGPGGTNYVVQNYGGLVRNGGTSDIMNGLYFDKLAFGFGTDPNVGIASQFAGNLYITNQGYSNYHGALVSLQKRFSRGFEFDVNYTFSHALDNNSSQTNTVTGGSICDMSDNTKCYSDADFDIRHLFNANFIWDLPFGRERQFGTNMPKWLDAVIGGWTVSGIMSARSGFAINSSSGAFGLRFNVTTPSILVGDKSLFEADIHDEAGGIQYFTDPEAANGALRYPLHGEIGTRNVFRSPGFWGFDFGLAKKFRMPWSEGHTITIRADSFNVTNTNQFSTPDITFNSTTFGRITGSLSTAREIQFAIRYDF